MVDGPHNLASVFYVVTTTELQYNHNSVIVMVLIGAEREQSIRRTGYPYKGGHMTRWVTAIHNPVARQWFNGYFKYSGLKLLLDLKAGPRRHSTHGIGNDRIERNSSKLDAHPIPNLSDICSVKSGNIAPNV